MFDLDAQRRGWRDALLREDALGPTEVDELEDHLLSEIEVLETAGLSEEEAFWVAAKQVGDKDALALEFGKVNRKAVWSKRAQWMLAGYLAVTFLAAFIKASSNGVAILVASFNDDASVTAVTYIGTSALLFVLILFLVVTYVRREPVSHDWIQRSLERARRNVALSAVAAAVAVLLLWFLGVVSQSVLTHRLTHTLSMGVEMSNYGSFSTYTAYFRLLVSVLLPPAVIVAILRLQATRR